MEPLGCIVDYFEKNFNFKSLFLEIDNAMAKFSSEVSVFLKYVQPVDREILKRKQVQKLVENPFLVLTCDKLPFPLKYIASPLKKPEFVDFGDHAIFYASGGDDLGSKYLFNLPNHQGYKLYKTIGMKNVNDLSKITPFKPMEDLFDIGSLREQLENPSVDKQDKKLVLAQILMLHSEYRCRLLNLLGVSVDLAVCTSKTGEWQIRPDLPRISVAAIDSLNDDQLETVANDIKKYFHLEKLFCVNLLGETPGLFDNPSIIQLFDYFNGHAVIKENPEVLSYLSEDIESRHQTFLDLMEQNYPKELMVKVLRKDKHEVNGRFELIEKLLELENDNPVIFKILELYDQFNIPTNCPQGMALDCFAILSWLKSKASGQNEIMDLVKMMLESVPQKDLHVNNFEKVVDNHFEVKNQLKARIYASLSSYKETQELYSTYDRAVVMIQEIISKLDKSAGDHFWLTFAEDFLAEIEDYLTNLSELPKGGKLLENELLVLKAQQKMGVELSPTALLDTLHRHLVRT